MPCSIVGHVLAHSFSNLFTNVPTRGKISTWNSSPALRLTGGFRLTPTPAGVPVTMTVPGVSVVPWDRKLTSFGTLKMRSLCTHGVSGHSVNLGVEGATHLMPQSWTTLPLWMPLMRRLPGLGTAVVDTMDGPDIRGCEWASSRPLKIHLRQLQDTYL